MATTKINGDTQDGMSEGGGHWCAESCCKRRERREMGDQLMDKSIKTLPHPLDLEEPNIRHSTTNKLAPNTSASYLQVRLDPLQLF